MPNVPLDAAFVRNATCPPGKNKIDYYDTAITGFIVEARSSGGKTYHLRHSFASFLVNAGRSVYEVQKILGLSRS